MSVENGSPYEMLISEYDEEDEESLVVQEELREVRHKLAERRRRAARLADEATNLASQDMIEEGGPLLESYAEQRRQADLDEVAQWWDEDGLPLSPEDQIVAAQSLEDERARVRKIFNTAERKDDE